jgi:hypothetical protein
MLKRSSSLGSFVCLPGLTRRRLQAAELLLLLISLFGWVGSSHGQAMATADKTGQLNVFGAYTFTSPDYGTGKDNGFTVGGDFLLRRFLLGQPGIAARYSRVTGSVVNETFAGGGLESFYKIGIVRPYITALYGVGGLSVGRSHYSDSGGEFLIGGGADVPISHRFAARGEFTYGFLNIAGQGGTSKGELSLNPASVTLGVVYHIR